MEPSAGAVVTISVPPDLPFPLMQGAPPASLCLWPPKSQGCTHTWLVTSPCLTSHCVEPPPYLSLHELEGWGS